MSYLILALVVSLLLIAIGVTGFYVYYGKKLQLELIVWVSFITFIAGIFLLYGVGDKAMKIFEKQQMQSTK